MDRQTLEPLRRLQAPVYFVAALMIVTPALDFVANVWPLRPGNLEWRYGTIGLLSGFAMTPLIGMLIVTGTAGLLGHARVLRVGAIVSLVVAVLLALATVLFVLDVLQFRPTVPLAAVANYDLGSWKAALKHLLVVVALAWLGHAAWRAARRSALPR